MVRQLLRDELPLRAWIRREPSPRSPRRPTRRTRPPASSSARSSAICGGTHTAGSSRTSRSTRSGCRAASSSASRPPKLWPTTSTRSRWSASSVSTRSPTWAPRFHGGSQSDTPCPRRSGAKTWNAPSRSSARRRKRPPQLVTPCRQSSGGASVRSPVVHVKPHAAKLPERARGAVRHPREPAGARGSARRRAREGGDGVLPRRRPRRLRPVPARDVVRAARDRRADDVHPRQRRAVDA